jgi:hypothetical protein
MITRSTVEAVQHHAQQEAFKEWREYHARQTPMAVYYDSKEQHLSAIARQAQPGTISQFGVDGGATLRLLSSQFGKRRVWGFDAWHKKGPGLPETWTGNIDHSRHFTWTREEYKRLRASMPKNVRLKVGLFEHDKVQHTMGDAPASVIHIDADTYSPAKLVLEAMSRNIVPGTRIVFDEYANYPGWRHHEHKAWHEFCVDHKVKYEYTGIAHMDVSVLVKSILK